MQTVTRNGSGSANMPTPRVACVSSAAGFMNDTSSSPATIAWARSGEPSAIRSQGVKRSPPPLPIVR